MYGLLLHVTNSVVYLCAGQNSEPCKYGWTDWDAVWEADSCMTREPWITWETGSAHWQHLVNTAQWSVCRSDAASWQIILGHLVNLVVLVKTTVNKSGDQCLYNRQPSSLTNRRTACRILTIISQQATEFGKLTWRIWKNFPRENGGPY